MERKGSWGQALPCTGSRPRPPLSSTAHPDRFSPSFRKAAPAVLVFPWRRTVVGRMVVKGQRICRRKAALWV